MQLISAIALYVRVQLRAAETVVVHHYQLLSRSKLIRNGEQ